MIENTELFHSLNPVEQCFTLMPYRHTFEKKNIEWYCRTLVKRYILPCGIIGSHLQRLLDKSLSSEIVWHNLWSLSRLCVIGHDNHKLHLTDRPCITYSNIIVRCRMTEEPTHFKISHGQSSENNIHLCMSSHKNQ